MKCLPNFYTKIFIGTCYSFNKMVNILRTFENVYFILYRYKFRKNVGGKFVVSQTFLGTK